MNEEDLLLAQEYDDQLSEHTRANLLARVEKLLQYDYTDTGSREFAKNFRECQDLYERLEEIE